MAKFIVLYGANNLGKSTQIELLKAKVAKLNLPAKFIKYPIYDLEPTGPLLNNLLRHPEKVDRKYNDEEFQQIYAQNRRDYEPTLIELLTSGITVFAEDYTGTGIAWGLTKGVELNYLEKINSDLKQPDLCLMLDGETRFHDGIEKGHRHEAAGEAIWLKNRDDHRFLAKRYGWQTVNAIQPKQTVHQQLWSIISMNISQQ